MTGIELIRAVPLTPSDIGEGPRRVLNVIVAAVGLVLTAPCLLVVAALVKLTSPGPIFYRQIRVGLDRRAEGDNGNHRRALDQGGRPFMIYKFRTMRAANPDAPQVWAAENDPRITRLGRVLRQYRLDELPQLFNVLRGDMNVVGPRPEQPTIFAKLRGVVPNYHKRQRVRPGITGWAQVNQRYDTSIADVERKVALDLEYVGRESLFEDLKIMARTLPVMLFGRGAR